MNFQNISSENSGTIYAGFLEWNLFKLIYIIFHILLTFVAPSVLSCIVWYERYGSELRYRTMAHMILSNVCVILIARCFTTRIPHIAILFISPLSPSKCDAIIFFARYSFLCTCIEIAIWQLAKYFYIFKWQHVVGLNDKFFSNYLTMCNLLLSAIFLFVTYMIGYHNAELDYHICTGNSPTFNILMSFRYHINFAIF